MENNGIYYIVVFDKDTFRLSETHENSTKTNYISINFSSNFGGTINPINPPIKVVRNSSIVFDLSDSSLSYLNLSALYSAFEFNLYADGNFVNKWEKFEESLLFDVQRVGSVGVTDNASLTINVNDKTPEVLFIN